MRTREFHLGDILSVTTGHLVSPRGMDGVYDILNFMTGDNLFSHQLSRAADEMRPRLLSQHPELAHITGDGVTPMNHREWLAGLAADFRKSLLLVQSEHQFHEIKDPATEAREMVGSDHVLIVELP